MRCGTTDFCRNACVILSWSAGPVYYNTDCLGPGCPSNLIYSVAGLLLALDAAIERSIGDRYVPRCDEQTQAACIVIRR